MSTTSPDLYRPRFSQRYGRKEIPEPVRPGEISEKARKRLWDNLFEAVEKEEVDCDDWGNPIFHVGHPWFVILKAAHTEFFELTVDEFSPVYDDFLSKYKDLICGSDEDALSPEELLDLIEEIIAHRECPPESVDDIAETFEKCRLPYGVNKTSPASIYVAEDEATRKLALEPALAVLSEPRFEVADEEFRSAMKEYKNGSYADCLVKCGSAFESVLKVICKSNGWSFDETDTAGQLMRTVVERSSLDSFFKEPLALIATMRHRMSAAHGGGDRHRAPQRHVARYAVSSVAAAVILLVNAAGLPGVAGDRDDGKNDPGRERGGGRRTVERRESPGRIGA